ncbi:MAG: hypothetical protein F6K26_00570 [Moorea sp. SIO2I5]|nr:hypothetical protein [Moorena sp. SIO2I5]
MIRNHERSRSVALRANRRSRSVAKGLSRAKGDWPLATLRERLHHCNRKIYDDSRTLPISERSTIFK